MSAGNVQQQEPTKYLPMKPQYGEEPNKSTSKTRPFKVTERKATQMQVTQTEETSYQEKPPAPAYVQPPEEPAAQPPAFVEKPAVKEESSKKLAPSTAYRDGISEQVKDIVKKFSFNRPREYTIKSRIPKPKKE